jgi:hypothetical protein
MIEKLRDEIVESQKARTDLMKWKLILVAAVGAAAFGIGSNAATGSDPPFVLLALIPWICLYVDAICIHNDLRIMAIARFLRTGGNGSVDLNSIERKYEAYCAGSRAQFSLEGFALQLTTLGLSLLVFFIGRSNGLKDLIPAPAAAPDLRFVILGWSGGVGAVAGLVFAGLHRYQASLLDK